MAQYKEDTHEKKVDLGIGAYRDDNAKPWYVDEHYILYLPSLALRLRRRNGSSEILARVVQLTKVTRILPVVKKVR